MRSLKLMSFQWSLICVLVLLGGVAEADDMTHVVNLDNTATGSLSVTATLGGVELDFLLDTGASVMTVNAEQFKAIRQQTQTEKTHQIGARLANGKIQLMDVYRVESLSLGQFCELGPVDVAVARRGGRNLLGLSILSRAAPFTISVSPPSLALSQCISDTVAAR